MSACQPTRWNISRWLSRRSSVPPWAIEAMPRANAKMVSPRADQHEKDQRIHGHLPQCG
ncbi:MAG: hypothetical protein M5U08_22830 [Burkholderiales bacterium]|nr:hypothetical protein [Burkholderiales bacterium]